MTLVTLAACARPLPDRLAAPRGRYVREVVDKSGKRCISELPLTVAFDDGVTPAEFFAADLPWSQGLGYPVTTPAVSTEAPDILVTLDVRPVEQPTWLASTSSECDGGRLRIVITMYVAGDYIQTYYVLMHEIGHALGVRHARGDRYGHNPNPWSVMYPIVEPSLMSDEAPAQWVRPDDLAALRRVWRRR